MNEIKMFSNIIRAGPQVLKNITSLELFVKDSISNSFNFNPDRKKQVWGEYLSWTGSKNNPPDFIIKNGSAGEIKKIESVSLSNQIQFNSSEPIKTLSVMNPRITKACIQCERWIEKPMIYVIGHTMSGKLFGLFVISGTFLYSPMVENIVDSIESSIINNQEISTVDTNEISRINNIGFYQNISLRIRGMFLVDHPLRTFKNIVGFEGFSTNICRLISLLDVDSIYGKVSSNDKEEMLSLGVSVDPIVVRNNVGDDIEAVLCKKNLLLED